MSRGVNIDEIVSSLSKRETCNEGLQFLHELNVNRGQEIVDQISRIIGSPDMIENTHSFSSLLVEFGREEFIGPLAETIFRGVPGESDWLSNYLYALNGLLEWFEEEFDPGEDFIHRLGDWIFSTGGGEISWKAGGVLSKTRTLLSRDYLLKGTLDVSLFHLTRVECLRGIVNHFRDEADGVLQTLVEDANSNVREAALSARNFLKEKSDEDSTT